MQPATNGNANQPAFNNPLLNRFFLSPEEKKNKEKGREIVRAFYTQQTANDSINNYKGRNARWIEAYLWAKGSQSMKEFLDYMNVALGESNKAWVNIDLTQQRVAAQFVGTIVESYAKFKVYPCVNAIDDGSLSEKELRQLEALFRMNEAQAIAQLQQETGIQLEPTNVYVPDDELSAKVHFQLEDRLPKEIRFEQYLKKVQEDIKFERVLNRKSLNDLVVVNLGATKIEKCGPKHYTVRRCIPTNMIYNFFMNDSGDLEVSMIGEFYSLKVREFRAKFGKTADRPEGLDEKQIYELAKTSTNKNLGQFNYAWNDNWGLMTYSQSRPYDDCSVFVLDAEINFEEDVYYVSKPDAYGREDVQQKSGVPYQQVKKDGSIIQQPKPEGAEIIKRQKNTWMRGVYAPYGDIMLYWGRPDLIISQYTDTGKPLSSYTINIPNNDGEYVPSLFERILEPLKEYTLTKLKRKQLIAKVKPQGIRIDVESARNIDLGNGDSIAWEEVVRVHDQTGNELWSSKGLDPLAKESPAITPGAVMNTINDIIGLTNVLAGIVLEIRQLIGVPMYRDGSDVGDRTAARLQEGQLQSAYNVTDFILNANNELWEDTFKKLCLLHWNDVVKEEPESKDDLLNTRFDIKVEMRDSEYEKQVIEKDIQLYSQMPDAKGNPSLSLKDAMFIRATAATDGKLAQWYLAKTFEENRRKALEESIALQKQNGEEQRLSLMEKAKADQALLDKQAQANKDLAQFNFDNQKQLEVLKIMGNIAAKAENPKMPKEFLPIIQQLIPNITIPLAEQNEETQEKIVQEQVVEEVQQQQAAQQMMMQQGQQQMIPQ